MKLVNNQSQTKNLMMTRWANHKILSVMFQKQTYKVVTNRAATFQKQSLKVEKNQKMLEEILEFNLSTKK